MLIMKLLNITGLLQMVTRELLLPSFLQTLSGIGKQGIPSLSEGSTLSVMFERLVASG